MPLFDHVSLIVSEYERSKVFYQRALEPLGVELLKEYGQSAGFGRNQEADFWISPGPSSFHEPEQLRVITPIHVAFAARSRSEVEAFHRAALGAGGRDYGAPGLRPIYHPNYYGAFVLDPDGHNIEAVYHEPA